MPKGNRYSLEAGCHDRDAVAKIVTGVFSSQSSRSIDGDTEHLKAASAAEKLSQAIDRAMNDPMMRQRAAELGKKIQAKESQLDVVFVRLNPSAVTRL